MPKAFTKKYKAEFEAKCREIAREEFDKEGEIEIDENAKVSTAWTDGHPGGAYVEAWVWVSVEVEET